jgi:hypothetical protein
MSAPTVYQDSPIKPKRPRKRRTNAELRAMYDAEARLLADDNPMTVRGVFYRVVDQRLVAKTDKGYDAVQRDLVKLRRAGEIPYHWISDSTRWMRKPRTYDSFADALRINAETYRRSLWANQDAYVEIWCEKDTLAGILVQETEPYDVPLMVSRGFSSITYLYEAAQTIREQGKPAFIYLLTDHDPSGLKTAKAIADGLKEHAAGHPIAFKRLAVTEQQIRDWDLPTRPTKASSHSNGFVGESVELDAIPARLLRQLVRGAIERHIDRFALEQTKAQEQREQELYLDLAESGLPS